MKTDKSLSHDELIHQIALLQESLQLNPKFDLNQLSTFSDKQLVDIASTLQSRYDETSCHINKTKQELVNEILTRNKIISNLQKTTKKAVADLEQQLEAEKGVSACYRALALYLLDKALPHLTKEEEAKCKELLNSLSKSLLKCWGED